ncbi:MAG: hypothetical protein DRJ59_08385 [Thermoprotei archaeon]|nr:MAG: hypothetical protein DRJ59_08385 [Thermoprotei archaeon]
MLHNFHEEPLISSANISKQGFRKWFEIGIVTNDPNVVNKAREFSGSLEWKNTIKRIIMEEIK